jgi:hypothetical protein
MMPSDNLRSVAADDASLAAVIRATDLGGSGARALVREGRVLLAQIGAPSRYAALREFFAALDRVADEENHAAQRPHRVP